MNAYPIAKANGPYSGETTDTISFSSAGSVDPDGTISKYDWDFGDGSAHSSAANPTHAYVNPGNYNVKLTVTDNTNLVTYVIVVCAVSPKLPIADAGGPYSGKLDTPVSFDSSGSYDPDGTIVEYRWDFGDGTGTFFELNPNHTYSLKGNYTVTLTVKDNHNAIGTDVTWCFVAANPPIADAGGPYSGVAVDPISFNSSGSYDPDGEIMEYRWDFGDGSNYSYEQNPSHAYALKGNYTVTLTVKDNDNATSLADTWCDVTPRPPVANANGPYSGIKGEPMTLSSAGSEDLDGEIAEYRWSFGDGSGTFYEENPSHSYTETGTFTVTLTVTDNDGLTNTATTTCIVELPPNVLPSANANGPYEGKVGDTITFSSAGSHDPDPEGEIVEYTWDFGDGSDPSHEQNPTHAYERQGTYTVELTVRDDRDGTATAEAVCTISSKPFPILPLIGGIVAIGAVAGVYFLKLRKPKEKPPKPASFRLMAEPMEVPADGSSTSVVTVEFLDEGGKPIKASEDTEVALSTTLGKISSPLTIREGESSGEVTLTAGVEVGTFQVTAEAKGIKIGSISLTFTEKKRYCMHCGSKMSVDDVVCPKCMRMPPSGVDVKECPNCGEVIPSVAKYCSACGARQPESEG